MTAAEQLEASGTFYQQGSYDQALAAARDVLADAAATAEQQDQAWRNMAICHLELNQVADADGALQNIHSAEYRTTVEQARLRLNSPAHDLVQRAGQATQASNYPDAVALYEEALRVEGLDDNVRIEIYRLLAWGYLMSGDFGRAEEYHVAAGSPEHEQFETERADLMTIRGVTAATLPHYDGSEFDDAFARGRDLYNSGDFSGALAELGPITQGTIGRGGFGEEVWLYVALCHLGMGNRAEADSYAGFLTGTWLDNYNEHAAQTAP